MAGTKRETDMRPNLNDKNELMLGERFKNHLISPLSSLLISIVVARSSELSCV